MKLLLDPLGFLIVPETAEEGFQVGRLMALMLDDPSIQFRGHCDLLVNTKQLNVVDETLPWQGTGLGRVGFIKKLLEK